ncbi:MAG: DUF1059 domain-containing protein [Methanotrichaceae archaeon]
MARQSDLEQGYREYMCREITNDKTCGFRVQAKTDSEAMEHARRHQEEAHGMKEMSPEMERNIKSDIQSVPASEERKRYTCSEPGCDFSVTGKDKDEVIEHAHMHQEMEHGVIERTPESEKNIEAHVTPVTIL